MESVYSVDENNNNVTMKPTIQVDNNIGKATPNCAQQVVMVSSVSSGSSSSLSSTGSSSCCSTTSGNSSASSTSSLASHNHHHHHHNHQQHIGAPSQASSTVKVEQEAWLLQMNDSNKLNNTSPSSLPSTTTTTTNNNTAQAPKPRGRRKKIRTEPIRPICPQCEKQFSNQSALTKHKLTHSDERKFACQQCSKAFKRHDHLTGHMQTHSNRKPFNCTIQGCDKTYCDARSLRRHKENIHHIVTPKETNANGSSTNINQQQQQQQQQQQHQQQQDFKAEQISCLTSSTVNSINQQPSHLLRRRIHRLHSDPGGQFDDEAGSSLDTDRHTAINNHDQQHYHHLTGQTPQQHHYHFHHEQHQAPFSADYASTQHFFDFNQMTPVEQQYCNGGSMPHSADSINDSGLSSAHYEHQQSMTPHHTNPPQQQQQQQQQHNNNGYITPTTLHPPTPTMLAPQQSAPQTPYTPNEHQTYQQHTNDSFSSSGATIHHQPSQLLRKRIQRLRSDPGGPHEPPLPDLMSRPIGTNRRSVDIINHQQQASYSADYASTQHFSFDFNHQMAPTTTLDQQYCNGSTGTIPPHSADSITDSSIELSVHYEHQPMTPNHHHHSGYITPITPNTQHPSTPGMLAPPQSATASYASPTNGHQHQSHQGYQQQTVTIVPPPNFTSSNTNQQPSHLLRRRIQRFQSDPGDKIENVACRPIETERRSVEVASATTTNTTGTNHYQYEQNNQQINHQHQQASFSADYASTQHFSFEFTHMTPMNQQFCQGHSVDSINDSSLGLSVHYEQMTPNSGDRQQSHQQHSGYITPTTLHASSSPNVLMQQQQSQQVSFTNTNDQRHQMIVTSPQ